MDSLQSPRDEIIEMARIWNGSDYIDLDYVKDQIWSTVFHSYGTCHTFDLSQVKEWEFISYKTDSIPGIEFVLTDDNPYNDQ